MQNFFKSLPVYLLKSCKYISYLLQIFIKEEWLFYSSLITRAYTGDEEEQLLYKRRLFHFQGERAFVVLKTKNFQI